MKKAIIISTIYLLIIVNAIPYLGCLPLDNNPNLIIDSNTLYVGGSGEGNYSKIQDAIDNASDGDIVFVYNDSSPYFEHIVINKQIDLIGEDRETTIIDGYREGTVITINGLNITLCGFTVCNSSLQNHVGIRIMSENVTLHNNIIEHNRYGIKFESANHVQIYGNNIINNGLSGVLLHDSWYNEIFNNYFKGNWIGYEQNIFEGLDNYYNTVSQNTFFDNTNSICLTASTDNIISDNNISNSNVYGIKLAADCHNNTLFHNQFSGNGQNAYDFNPYNRWDNGYPCGGNFWDDYTGRDFYSGPNQDEPGSDGIGDIPYEIEGGNQDRYPLYTLWQPLLTIEIQGGKGVTLVITNSGDLDATSVNWSIMIKNGLFITPTSTNGTIGMVGGNDFEEVNIPVFGIGLGIFSKMPYLIAMVECHEGSFDSDCEYAKIFFLKVTIQ